MQLTGSRPSFDRLARWWSAMSNTFWILILALIALFAFFLALGAYNPGDILPVTLVVVGLTLLWLGHAWYASRHAAEGRDPASIRARERRGF